MMDSLYQYILVVVLFDTPELIGITYPVDYISNHLNGKLYVFGLVTVNHE